MTFYRTSCYTDKVSSEVLPHPMITINGQMQQPLPNQAKATKGFSPSKIKKWITHLVNNLGKAEWWKRERKNVNYGLEISYGL